MKPTFSGEFVIVDEGDQVARSVSDGPISCQRNVFFRLPVINNRASSIVLVPRHEVLRRARPIVVDDDHLQGKGWSSACEMTPSSVRASINGL